MKHKILWLDTETTGLDSKLHGVHQVAGVIEIGAISKDNTVETFNVKTNPLPNCQVSEWVDKNSGVTMNALEISGKSTVDLYGYQSYVMGMIEFMGILSTHVDRFNKSDKFILAGYNVGFDKDMLFGWASQVNEKYLSSFVDHRVIDVMSLARTAYAMGVMGDVDDFKLSSLCAKYNIEINAHDALSDILATRELFFVLIDLIKGRLNDS